MAKRKQLRTGPALPRDPDQTARLIERCRHGDAAAAEVIFARYTNRLTALARSRLSRRLAARFDPSDVVMSAYRSFFVGLRGRGFVIADESELWQLLVQITLRKLYRQVARHGAAKRIARRDVSIHLPDGSLLSLPGREPGPAEAAVVADEVEFLLAQFPPVGRRILELRLQGDEIATIASEVRVNERTVRRWLDRAKELLTSRREQSLADEMPMRIPTTTRDANRIEHRKTRPTNHRAAASKPFPPSLRALEYKDFILQKMIGAGASGKIYRALCPGDGRSYALKFLRKAFLMDYAAVRRFEAEFTLVSGLHHPHIMPVIGWGRTPAGGCFFAMELASSDLQQHVGRLIPVKQAVEWLRQAALGVRYAHTRGIIHRDLKPSNLLLSHDSTVLVSDFGLAWRIDDVTGQGLFAGTPAFTAPEQITSHRKDVSPRTDIYGLGATLYALLAGRPPFGGKRASDVLAQVVSAAAPIALTTFRKRLSADVEGVCLRCLAKKPRDRFPSVGALIETLAKCKL